jgi:hypothetical protein
VVIAYDDSDGWYDHALGQIVNQSSSEADALSGTGHCGWVVGEMPGSAPVPHILEHEDNEMMRPYEVVAAPS